VPGGVGTRASLLDPARPGRRRARPTLPIGAASPTTSSTRARRRLA